MAALEPNGQHLQLETKMADETFEWERVRPDYEKLRRMSDRDLLAAVKRACRYPRSDQYLNRLMLVTRERRQSMPLEMQRDLQTTVAVTKRRYD
jgi:hypothetical protein